MVLRKLSQTLKVTLAVTLSVLSSGLTQLYTAPIAAAANNGTLKVHEFGTASDTESNDPKVCIFNFEGFQFDAGQSGLIVVEPQGGDSETTDTVSLPFGPTNDAGYAETAYINNGGAALSDGHYKSTLYGKDVNNEYTVDLKAKSKVFKVECETTPTVTVCPATLPLSHSTNLDNNGWTLGAGAEYVDGGVKLSVPGNWEEATITRVLSGDLADLGTNITFTPGTQYLGLHVETSIGTLVYEQEPTYGGNWWSTSDFGVGPGMGYATFGSLEDIVAANPGVTLESLTVLYTSPVPASTTVTSVKIGCIEYTFDKEVVTPVACPAVLPAIHATNTKPNGWVLSENASYVTGGVKLNVNGNWDETTVTRALTGTLKDIGSEVDFTPGTQYLGLHVETSIGTLVYEQEPTYGGNWWSTSDFGVGPGMGYATFGSLEDIVAANPGVTLESLTVLYTSPIESSTTLTSVTFGCTVYTFGLGNILGDGDTKTPPTNGGGQGTSTPTPGKTLSASTELPATLPATGGSSNPFMIIIASLMAYGAAYLIQGRRLLARNEA